MSVNKSMTKKQQEAVNRLKTLSPKAQQAILLEAKALKKERQEQIQSLERLEKTKQK